MNENQILPGKGTQNSRQQYVIWRKWAETSKFAAIVLTLQNSIKLLKKKKKKCAKKGKKEKKSCFTVSECNCVIFVSFAPALLLA